MAQKVHQLFQLLEKDHREAEQMMKQLDSCSQNQREEVFIELRDELSEHMQLEEKHFYPKLKQISEMKEQVQDALEEHKESKEFLAQLEEMGTDAREWQETFSEMQQGIQHHVQDEEQKIFPQCTQFLNDRQLDEIAQKCIQDKEKARPSRIAAGKGAARKQKPVQV